MKKKNKKTFADRAYQTTNVPRENTKVKIGKMLEEIGITDVRITQVGGDYTLEFIVKLQHDENPRKVRMDVPFTKELAEEDMKAEQRQDAIFRVIYWHLRDKFIAIRNGLKEFEEEFLADLVIIADGREQRLGDVIVPQYKHQLKSSKVAILRGGKLIGNGGGEA